jgi:hypothetical protein|tara:strand:- start:376 stop:594 length:219 start_codon:yes stop_codon:yes gene_type:complete
MKTVEELKEEYKEVLEDDVLSKIFPYPPLGSIPDEDFDWEGFVNRAKEYSKGFAKLIKDDLELTKQNQCDTL